MIEAQLPDGTTLEFPDGTPDHIVDKTVKSHLGMRGVQPIGGDEAGLRRLGDFGRAVLRGARDIPDEGARMLTGALEGISESPVYRSLSPFSDDILRGQTAALRGERENVQRINRAAQKDYAENWRRGEDVGMDFGRLVGNVAATLPLAFAMPGAGATSLGGQMLSGSAIGAATGALQPVDEEKFPDYWQAKAGQTAAGAGGGAVAPLATRGISRLISPKSSPQVQKLLEEGVSPTPGQTLGGMANITEEKLQSMPILGDAIRAGRRRAVEQFNRGAINTALRPIGKALPKGTPLGREAIAKADDIVSSAYDDILPKLSVRADDRFVSDVSNLAKMTAEGLDEKGSAQFQKILKDKLLSKFAQGGGITGESFKTVESEIGRLARNYRSSAVASERELGMSLSELQSNLRDLLVRSNPSHASRLRAINKSYAMLVRLEDAAGRIGAAEGVFNPGQLRAAVRSKDSSLGKRAFAKGQALMQDYAEAGTNVLGSKYPDSGTAGRALLNIGTLGALGGAGMVAPQAAIGAGVGLGAASIPYAPYVQGGLARLLASRPELLQQIAPYVNALAPAASAAGGPVAASMFAR